MRVALDRSHQRLRRRSRNVVARPSPQDWSRNRLELRRIPLLHILLHGTAHAAGQARHGFEGEFRVDFGTLGGGDRARFFHGLFEQLSSFCIRNDVSNRPADGGGAQGDRREEDEFLPEEGCLAVHEPANKTDLLKLLERAFEQLAALTRNTQPAKRRRLRNSSRCHALGFHGNRCWNHGFFPEAHT